MEYRIYAKHATDKRFAPIDSQARQVKNLIYASIFTEEEKDKAMEELTRCNPEVWKFRAVPVKK